MPLRVKNSESRARLSGQSGQALIEYVLMLIISVSLVLALMSQIFEPFQKFIQSYMGDYVSCLLETGELPSLGGDDTALADQGCDTKFVKATWKDGRPSSNTGGSSSNTDSTSNHDTSPSDSDSSSGSSSNSNRYAGSNSRNGGRYFSTPSSRGSGIDGDAGANKKVVEIALDGGGSGSFFSKSSSSSVARQQQKTTYVPITGLTDAEKKKVEKKEANKQRLVAGEGFAPPPKKTSVKKPEPKPLAEEKEDSFTIGNFIRILFIAAIVIALLIFIGGQALQMSKGMEK